MTTSNFKELLPTDDILLTERAIVKLINTFNADDDEHGRYEEIGVVVNTEGEIEILSPDMCQLNNIQVTTRCAWINEFVKYNYTLRRFNDGGWYAFTTVNRHLFDEFDIRLSDDNNTLLVVPYDISIGESDHDNEYAICRLFSLESNNEEDTTQSKLDIIETHKIINDINMTSKEAELIINKIKQMISRLKDTRKVKINDTYLRLTDYEIELIIDRLDMCIYEIEDIDDEEDNPTVEVDDATNLLNKAENKSIIDNLN